MINHIKSIDYKLLIAVICLSIFGIVMIYSASSYSSAIQHSDSLYYVKKQIVALVFGIAIAIAVSYMKLDLLIKYRMPILIISLILLGLVFIPGLGVENYGAKRWINLGFTTIQVSEISKFGMVIFLSSFMATKDMTKFKNISVALVITGLFCVLIMLEPNMSITMCVGIVMIAMLFISGVKIKQFAILSLPIMLIVALLIIIEPYRMQRILAFIDPWASPKGDGYQLIQSYYALGSGGLFGIGLFNSRQKYLFLPFAESDFILAIIGEELGIVGVVTLMLVCFYTIYRGIVIAINSGDRYKTILAGGIVSIYAVQTLINIAVVTGSIPPTGLPLPFISSGGSSLVSFMAAMGLLLNISKGCPSTLNILNP